MAPVASQSRMLALQVITSFAVVETSGSGRPLDDFEILAIVLGVAASALLAGVSFQVVRGVQAVSSSDPGGDLGMAFEALQSARSAQFVAGSAIGGAVQRSMRPR